MLRLKLNYFFLCKNTWVIDIAELVNGDKFDVDILYVCGDKGNLQTTDGGRIVVTLDVASPALGVNSLILRGFKVFKITQATQMLSPCNP